MDSFLQSDINNILLRWLIFVTPYLTALSNDIQANFFLSSTPVPLLLKNANISGLTLQFTRMDF